LKSRQSSEGAPFTDALFSFMSKAKLAPETGRLDQPVDSPLKDALTQIQEAKNAIVAAVIAKAIDDGSYQHAKWLFEFGGITQAKQSSPEDEPSLMRLFLDQLQIPESPEEIAAEFSANDPALE
jgi:hypothetical protein